MCLDIPKETLLKLKVQCYLKQKFTHFHRQLRWAGGGAGMFEDTQSYRKT